MSTSYVSPASGVWVIAVLLIITGMSGYVLRYLFKNNKTIKDVGIRVGVALVAIGMIASIASCSSINQGDLTPLGFALGFFSMSVGWLIACTNADFNVL